MSYRDDPVMCKKCGLPQKDHYAVNYSDGQMVAATIYICPRAVFEAKKESRTK
jgi:hypothetical protein